MSNDPKLQNEDELWDVLSAPAADKKDEKPKEAPSPAPKAETRENKTVSGRKLDGFFYGSMAGVAAVSVAATLLVSSLFGGGGAQSASPSGSGSAGSDDVSVSEDVDALRRENAELKAQVELQQKTILDLQNNLMDFMGTEEFMENAATSPSGENQVLEKQTEAYEILSQIQTAYAEFDRETLEELIPEMDARLEYLSKEALNNYYLILEYMEQPSNG